MKRMYIAAAIIGCLSVLLFSGAVFAEGETPPEIPAEDTIVDTASEPDPISETAVEPATEPEIIPTGEQPAVEVVENPEAIDVQPEVENEALIDIAETSDLVEALVAADVILEDEDGEVLDLASAGTAEAIISGDPWWMVGTTKYATVFNLAQCPTGTIAGVTCWASATPINEALNRIVGMGKLPSDGKLHVEAGVYPDVININGSGSILANFKGIVGNPSVESSHSCDLTGSVYVKSTVSGFTLSGFDIDGYVTFYDNRGALLLQDLYVHDDDGIHVYAHNGAIKLNQVRAEYNGGYGALLSNVASGFAGVEVKNSSFNHNTIMGGYYAGLSIYSNGPVTLDGVSASNNNGDGVDIFDAKSLMVSNSVFSNNYTNPDAGAWGYGMYIVLGDTNAPITLGNVLVNHNENDGIYMQTMGKITLKAVVASQNGKDGAHLDNCVDSGGVCGSTYFNTVSVTASYFENNTGGDGLEIKSKGAVTLTSVHAYNNSGDGVNINNCMYDSGVCQGTGGVVITSILSQGIGGVNYFGWNDDYGLYVYTKGAISLNNFTAEYNIFDGVYLDNNQLAATAGVTVKSTLSGWVNSTENNGGDGLDVISYGYILVDKVIARSNGEAGLELDNDFADVVKNMMVSNSLADFNHLHGIHAESNGTVSIINSGASYNNLSDSGAYSGLYINNSDGIGNVVIKSTNSKYYYHFDYNSKNGVEIITNGTVNISNTIANYNADTVDDVNNDGFNIGGTIDPKTVTMTRCIADGNGWNGFQIQSQGFVLLTNVSARDNANHGISAYAGGAFTLKTVSGTPDNELFNNGNPFNADGLYANAAGTITILNTFATGNSAYGFALHNAPTLTTPVIIKLSTATYNHYGGIYINTAGNLTVTDTSASHNDSWGLMVDTDGSVTINCTKPLGYCTFSNNGTGHGLDVYSRKTITISKIVANDNGNGTGDAGMWLVSYFTPSPIILTNVIVESNFAYGIFAKTASNVTINSILARYNGTGVYIGESANKVNNFTMTGTNLIDSNGTGMRVYSLGLVNISNATIQHQTNGEGLIVYSAGEDKTVTLNNVTARFNYSNGIYISSEGNINLNTVRSLFNGVAGNDGDGLVIYLPDQEDIVTIKNSIFIYNFGNGIQANVYSTPIDYTKFILLSSSYLGNDADNDGNPDLFIY